MFHRHLINVLVACALLLTAAPPAVLIGGLSETSTTEVEGVETEFIHSATSKPTGHAVRAATKPGIDWPRTLHDDARSISRIVADSGRFLPASTSLLLAISRFNC
jgi:hypothetical protein